MHIYECMRYFATELYTKINIETKKRLQLKLLLLNLSWKLSFKFYFSNTWYMFYD